MIRVLKKLKTKSSKTSHPTLSVDIAGMQFDWRWHAKNFDNDPISVLSPTLQVKYFLDKYSRHIYDVCATDRVDC